MRVGIITPRYPPNVAGGGEVSVKLLADQLAAHDGIEVSVITFDGSETEAVDGVQVHRLGVLSTRLKEVANLRALAQLQGRLKMFDVVHGYNMELYPALGALVSRTNTPAVATLNSYEFFPKSAIGLDSRGISGLYETVTYPTTGRLLRRGMRQIDAFIALSEAVREVYVANGFANSRIEVIPNMLDPKFNMTASPGEVTPEKESAYNLLYVGALKQIKGVNHLIRAMTFLPDDIHLRIAGDGQMAERLRELVAELGVAHKITFLDHVDHEVLPTYYNNSDLFIHPGVWPEPFGRTLLEAMQSELPVVATEIGGPAEIVPEKHFCCPPGDPKSLAETIQFVRDRRSEAGRAHHKYVTEQYAPEVVTSQIIDLYEDVTGP